MVKDDTPPQVEPNQMLSDVLAKLPKVRSKWPKEVVLPKAQSFNFMEGDKVVGVVQTEAGAKVALIEIKPEHAVIRFAGAETPMPVMKTDIVMQMGGAKKILALPDDPPSPAVAPVVAAEKAKD